VRGFRQPGGGDFSACGRSDFFAAEKVTKKPPNLRFWNPFPIVTIACRRPALYVDTPLLSLR